MSSGGHRYAALSAQFYANRLLFGDASEQRTVAIEVSSRKEVEVFKRSPQGALTREHRRLRLFALVASADLLDGLRAPYTLTELAGDFRFRFLLEFASLDALDSARGHLRNVPGKAPGG